MTVFNNFIRFSFFLSLFSMLLLSCSSPSLEHFYEEGQGVMRSLVQDLQLIHDRDQLAAALPKLQNNFERLAAIMIAARNYSLQKMDSEESFFANHYELSDQLRVELNRIYQIEGARQMIEKAQERALFRLDAYEKSISKIQISPYLKKN